MSDTLFKRVPLSTVAVAIKDGTHGTHERVRNGVPFLSAKNITAGGVAFWDETDDCISNSEYEQIHKAFKLQRNDLLLTVVGSIGRRAIFDGSRVTFQRSVAFIRPDHNLISERFLFHWFGHGDFQNELIRRSNSTAQAGIYLGELSKALIPECHIPEQIKIAEILDTIETTIHQTEAIIEKLKQVKQGLMHDLLTRGIDANGELRPPQSEAPELYKESALGWIPREWDLTALGKLATNSVIGPFGSDLVADDYHSEGVPIVFVRDVKSDQFEWKSNVFITPKKAADLSAHTVRSGDVLVTKMGLPPCSAAVYPESMCDGVVTADIVRLRFDLTTVRSFFVSISINENSVIKQVERITAGVTRPKVTLRDVRNLLIRLPPLDEQDRILAGVAIIESRLVFENQELGKLHLQKSGLMDDLLTGRVRVTPLLESASA